MKQTEKSISGEKPSKGNGKKSLRVLQKESTLQLLLKSATHLFFRKGYAGTTIDDIAAHAGVSRATVYLHFSRKCAILQRIAEEGMMIESRRHYERLDELGIPSREALKAWLLEAMAFFKRHSKILSVYRQAKSIEPEIERHNLLFLRSCVDAMPNYLARWGSDREAYAKLRLNMLTLQLDDAASWILNEASEVNHDEVIEALLEYWTVALRAPS